MEESQQDGNRIVALYPLTKFYLAIVIAFIGALLSGILPKLLCFGILNLLAASSGIYQTFFKRVKNSIGVLFVILLIIQTLFYPGNEILFSFWIFSAKKEGLLFALTLGLNLLCVGGSLIWLFAVTTQRDFVLSLEKKGLGSQASYVLLSTLQMVPVLKKKSETIMNAQRARGVETEGGLLTRAKVFIPIIVPLALSSISDTEERALTLEARGFSAKTNHTYLYDIEPKPIDKRVTRYISICLVLFLVGRVILWVI